MATATQQVTLTEIFTAPQFDKDRGKTLSQYREIYSGRVSSSKDFNHYMSTARKGRQMSKPTKDLLSILFQALDNKMYAYDIFPEQDGFPTDERKMNILIQSCRQFFEIHVGDYWIGRSWGWDQITGNRVVTIKMTPGPIHAHGHRKSV